MHKNSRTCGFFDHVDAFLLKSAIQTLTESIEQVDQSSGSQRFDSTLQTVTQLKAGTVILSWDSFQRLTTNVRSLIRK